MSGRNHAMLGLFLLLGFGLLVGTAVWYVQQLKQRDTLDYVTYFDQPVNGLKDGAAVRFRGVDVGVVDYIKIAPQHAWIEIGFVIDLDIGAGLGVDLHALRLDHATPGISDKGFRVRLESNLVTGLSYLQVDEPAEGTEPPLELSFDPPRKYVPSMHSVTNNIIRTLEESLAALPGLVETINQAVLRVDQTLLDANVKGLSAEAAGIMKSTRAVIDRFDQKIEDADVKGLRLQLASLITKLENTTENARVPQVMAEVRQLLPQLRSALISAQRLASHIDQQPESLLFGPRQGGATIEIPETAPATEEVIE